MDNMNNGNVIRLAEAFILARKFKLSPETVKFYKRELRLFLSWLAGQGIDCLDDLSSDAIRLYLVELSERRNGGGCHAAYRAIKAWLRWTWEELDLSGRNPIDRVEPPKYKDDPLPGISLADVRAMVESCKADKMALRDKAIILTLVDTGLRASELLSLNVQDYDKDDGTILVRHGKGDKTRTVFAGKTTRRALTAYMKSRGGLKPFFPLFATRDGERLSMSGLRRIVERRAAQAGMKAPGLHDFRRCFAVNALRAGVDLVTLQRLMGHSGLEVLRRYLALDHDDLRVAHGIVSPADKLMKHQF